MKVSLAISPCPNDIFIFAGILTGAIRSSELTIEPHYLDIEKLNTAALLEKYDVIKVSAALLGELKGSYELLQNGGALGRGCGPLLLSHDGNLHDENPVLLPGVHTTAHFLFNYFSATRSLDKVFIPYDQLYEKLKSDSGSQGVVIHESRFTYQRDGLRLIQDLGEHWENQTGYPIPLGVIVTKMPLGIKENVEVLIRKSLDWSRQNFQAALDLCGKYAQEMSEEVIRSHIELYVNDFSWDMGDEGRKSIEFMLNTSLKH